MALEIITNHKIKEVKESVATISLIPKLRRIVINKATLDTMVKNYKRNFCSVVLLKDPEIDKTFWIRPCVPEHKGARKLGTIGKNTRILSCSHLFKKLEWLKTGDSKKAILATWDKENKALKVDLDD